MLPSGQVERLLNRVVDVLGRDLNVRAVAIVGSYANGNLRPDSDVDLVILCRLPRKLIEQTWWIKRIGPYDSSTLEDWGALSSLRVFHSNGLELEYGVTATTWARLPVDQGTAEVISGGMRIILDRDGLLESLQSQIQDIT